VIPRLALVPGEPAGIGPELCVRLAQAPRSDCTLAVFADPAALRAAADALALPLRVLAPGASAELPGDIVVHPIANEAPAVFGQADPRNARAVIEALHVAAQHCLDGTFDGLVTGPVHKATINAGGIPYSGTTELLAQQAGCDVVMMLANATVRVALATTHLPLRDVAHAITRESLERTLRILHRAMRRDFGLQQPRIAVLGLNPHAGEGGHLGREEIDVIAPALDVLRAQGLRITGPLSADTAFVPTRRADFDAYLAMYHDQGLPVLKALGFGESVNVTLGLPYPRTSVDHGVALDVAGRGIADVQSLLAAAVLACELAQRHARTSAP